MICTPMYRLPFIKRPPMVQSNGKSLTCHGCPSWEKVTGIIKTAMADEFTRKGVNEGIMQRIPRCHYAEAMDVANLVLFLASDESSYCSGSEFVVDGAMTA